MCLHLGFLRRAEWEEESNHWSVLSSCTPCYSPPNPIYFLTITMRSSKCFYPLFFFRLWHQDEPNFSAEECASLVFWNHRGWGWNDVFCDSKRNSICEMKKIYFWVERYSWSHLKWRSIIKWSFPLVIYI